MRYLALVAGLLALLPAGAPAQTCGFFILEDPVEGVAYIPAEIAQGLTDTELRTIARGDYRIVRCDSDGMRTLDGDLPRVDRARVPALDDQQVPIGPLLGRDSPILPQAPAPNTGPATQ